MKKYLLLFVAVMLATAARADVGDTFTFEGINYMVLDDNQTVEVANPNYGISGEITIPTSVAYNGSNYTVTKIGDNAFSACEFLTSITIPNSVTQIGAFAFDACRSLTSVTIPNSVTAIGDAPFLGCLNLTDINVETGNQNYCSDNGALYNKDMTRLIQCPCAKTEFHIPDSVTEIGDDAFSTTSLKSITIPSSVTSIGINAFLRCISLTSITIPDSVTSIGMNAFAECRSLTSAIISNSVTQIPGGAFSRCSSLTSVTIPNPVTLIDNSAFMGCENLTSITIPNSVTKIGSQAFYMCHSLKSITIPNSVTSIGWYAFVDCDALTAVYYPAMEPISGDYNTFSDYSKPTLYVWAEAVEKCRAIYPWKNFSKIEAYEFSGIDELTTGVKNEMPSEVYSLNGVMLGNSTDNLTPGIYIVRKGNTLNKIAVK